MAPKDLILVVDDDRDIRDALRVVLEAGGYEVATAESGRAALEAIEAQRPALVVLDIMMSTDTEGFDLAYKLRQDPDLGGMPIVLLTAFMQKVVEEGPEPFAHVLGEGWPAEWMFEKPVEPDKLLAKIEGILGSR